MTADFGVRTADGAADGSDLEREVPVTGHSEPVGRRPQVAVSRSQSVVRSPQSLLWINHFAATPAMGGGTRHVELGRELVRRGWDVRIFASDLGLHSRRYHARKGPSDRRVIREAIDGVDLDWLWAAPYERNDHRRVYNWLSFSMSVLGAPMRHRPDVIIGSSPHLFAALAGWLLAKRLRRPFVLEVRDLWPESLAIAGQQSGIGYHGLAALARSLYRVANRIIVLAEGVREYLVERGVPREKIVFVPNGVDASAFADVAPPARDRLRLVYAGAHGPANGLDVVLDAAAMLGYEPRVEFVLVGDGVEKPKLIRHAEEMGLTNVRFMDPVPKSAMPALLADCDAGLMVLKDLPLFSFGVSPNKLFDYWGASLPVVCNVPGEVGGLVAQARGGVQAEDGTAAGLAAAIRKMLTLEPAERRALGLSGQEWVTRERDRPVVAARLEKALHELLRSSSGAALSIDRQALSADNSHTAADR